MADGACFVVQVINESLRMFPPASGPPIARPTHSTLPQHSPSATLPPLMSPPLPWLWCTSAIRKRTVADTQLGPFSVKKGTGAMVSLWAVSKNPAIW